MSWLEKIKEKNALRQAEAENREFAKKFGDEPEAPANKPIYNAMGYHIADERPDGSWTWESYGRISRGGAVIHNPNKPKSDADEAMDAMLEYAEYRFSGDDNKDDVPYVPSCGRS